MKKQNCIVEGRAGYFYYTKDLLDSLSNTMLKDLFSRFIPTYVLYDPITEKYMMKGYSPLFEPLNRGDLLPEYSLEIEKLQKSRLKIKAVKK